METQNPLGSWSTTVSQECEECSTQTGNIYQNKVVYHNTGEHKYVKYANTCNLWRPYLVEGLRNVQIEHISCHITGITSQVLHHRCHHHRCHHHRYHITSVTSQVSPSQVSHHKCHHHRCHHHKCHITGVTSQVSPSQVSPSQVSPSQVLHHRCHHPGVIPHVSYHRYHNHRCHHHRCHITGVTSQASPSQVSHHYWMPEYYTTVWVAVHTYA